MNTTRQTDSTTSPEAPAFDGKQWLDEFPAFFHNDSNRPRKALILDQTVVASTSKTDLRELACLDEAQCKTVQESGMLPFDDGAFDAIMRLPDSPIALRETLIDEIKRALNPSGSLWLALPNPADGIAIQSRPIAHWLKTLRSSGFQTAARIANPGGVLEILATAGNDEHCSATLREFRGDANRIHHEGMDVSWTPHGPMQPANATKRISIYLLNHETAPAELSIQLETADAHHPDIFLGDLKLRYQKSQPGENGVLHHWETVTVPPGGHALAISSRDAAFSIHAIHAKTEPLPSSQFVQRLAFDHFQRYRMASDIVQRFFPNSARVLDVGGAKGFAHQFLPVHETRVIDVSHDDSPFAQAYDGGALPFEDRSFQAVMTLDTLEHIPEQQREPFLRELSRTASDLLVVGGPFDDAQVQNAEDVVRAFAEIELQLHDRFLDEHSEYSLPNLKAAKATLEQCGWIVEEYPNGYLPRWLMMQLTGFAMGVSPELAEPKAKLQSLYNQSYYPFDNREPAYRKILVATRKLIPFETRNWLKAYVSGAEAEPPKNDLNFTPLLVGLSSYQLIREKEKIIQANGERILGLLDHIENVHANSEQERQEREKLIEHTRNLEESVKQHLRHAENLASSLQGKDALESQKDKHAENLAALLQDKDRQIESAQKHIGNLDQERKARAENETRLNGQIASLLEANRSLQAHADNLAAMQKQSEEHNKNLLAHSENLAGQINSLQSRIHQIEEERDGLARERAVLTQERSALHQTLSQCIAALHQPSQDESGVDAIFAPIQDSVDPAYQETFAGMFNGLKQLATMWNTEKAQLLASQQLLIDTLQTIQSAPGFKLLTRVGMIPDAKEPPSS